MPPGSARELHLGNEAVAQHELERNRVEELVVDPEVLEVDEFEAVQRGDPLDGATLVGRAQRAIGRQEFGAWRERSWSRAQVMPPMALNIGM